MNTEAEHNCSPAKTCEVCLPQCSSGPHVSCRNRAERPLKYEADCGPRNCSIFGGHDTAPRPDCHVHQKPLKSKHVNKNSLGSPIGLVTSNVNFKTEGKTEDMMQARYATYLKAFARLHLNDEIEWDSQLLDDIMTEGLDLYTSSQNSQPSEEAVAAGIYMSHEQQVLREFQLSGFMFQVELMPKFQLLAGNSTELGAKGDGVELTLEDMLPALRKFLRQHKYGLLKVGSFYAMIWHSRGAYFVFDVCGRRLMDFQAVKENGIVMLMCFKSLENIRHLINNLSGLQIAELLVIRELKLVKVVTPQGSIMQQDYGLRDHQYEIVSDDYAYLRSDLHLSLNKEDLLRNRSGLPVAVTAIVVSKIDHPATWDVKMVDRIICFGVQFCQARWMKCKSTELLNVNEFPTVFILGQFRINIEMKGHLYQGIWHCVPVFKHSALSNALKDAFNGKYYKLILQINYQMYAIWKKQEFLYLLDPYRHRIIGKQNEDKSASVRMFRDFDVFMNVLNHILLDSNRTSHFSLHFIKVKNIQNLHIEKPGQVNQIEEPQRDDSGEILSINEHICFEEAENLCKAALAEISDYEDDDLKSDVVEMELRTSSSEEELLEEEAEAGDVGEMEDIESSSSGEEGGSHKKKTPGNQGRGENNSAKSVEAKKGWKNKNKKGKGANDHEKGGDVNEITTKGKDKKNKISDKTYKQMMGESTNRLEESDDEIDIRQENKRTKKNPDTDKLAKDSERTTKSKNIRNVQEGQTDKQKSENKDSSKDIVETSRNKEKDLLKGSNAIKDKEVEGMYANKNKDWSKSKHLNKNKELSKEKGLSEMKDLGKEKATSKGKHPNVEEYISKDKDFSQDKSLPADKIISKGRDEIVSKDNNLSKTFVEQNDGNNRDKVRQNSEDLNKSVHNGSKSDLAKSKNNIKDTNKENEMLKSSQKLKDLTKEHEEAEAEEVLKKNSVERFKERTENVHSASHERHDKRYNDGTEADDENEECLEKSPEFYSTPNPNRYPGYFKYPVDMAVIGSESGSYESICKLFQAGFKVADRLLLMTPWGNFVIFRRIGQAESQHYYFLFDGCTCNFDRFRHFDLSVGTAGLICFEHLHNTIKYVRQLRQSRRKKQTQLNSSADDICKEYCNKSLILRV